jgi:hypothetical protein
VFSDNGSDDCLSAYRLPAVPPETPDVDVTAVVEGGEADESLDIVESDEVNRCCVGGCDAVGPLYDGRCCATFGDCDINGRESLLLPMLILGDCGVANDGANREYSLLVVAGLSPQLRVDALLYVADACRCIVDDDAVEVVAVPVLVLALLPIRCCCAFLSADRLSSIEDMSADDPLVMSSLLCEIAGL